jgi:hypothetical protein
MRDPAPELDELGRREEREEAQAGKFEEAEAAACDLIARYREVRDGWDRLGMM